MPAGQPEDAEVTWRSLYACNNGWRGLQPGCFEMLDLPCSSERGLWMQGFPSYCILDSQDLSWTALAGVASELLVVVEWTSVLVSLRDLVAAFGLWLCLQHACSNKFLWPAGV